MLQVSRVFCITAKMRADVADGSIAPKWAVRAMSGLLPLATELRTSLVDRFVPEVIVVVSFGYSRAGRAHRLALAS
jgi:hypothetical protein